MISLTVLFILYHLPRSLGSMPVCGISSIQCYNQYYDWSQQQATLCGCLYGAQLAAYQSELNDYHNDVHQLEEHSSDTQLKARVWKRYLSLSRYSTMFAKRLAKGVARVGTTIGGAVLGGIGGAIKGAFKGGKKGGRKGYQLVKRTDMQGWDEYKYKWKLKEYKVKNDGSVKHVD